MRVLIEKLTERLMAWCLRTNRVLHITGTGGPDDIYLVRYYVFKSEYFNIFIHQFLRSDRDDMHDHPWHFATYLVRGAYTEVKWDEKAKRESWTRRFNYPKDGPHCDVGSYNGLVFRKATDQHKVLVDQTNTYETRHKAPLTVCVTGPLIREWGFVKTLADGISTNGVAVKWNSRKWVPWREYLGLPPDEPGRG